MAALSYTNMLNQTSRDMKSLADLMSRVIMLINLTIVK
jgi:hypothetical protein